MQRLLLTLLGILLTLILSAQTPEAFQYQAVVRNIQGQVIAEQAVSFRISLLKGSANGTTVYTETHTTTTNAFGLVNLQIGMGSATNGTFSDIAWGSDSYFVQVELDETGGSNYRLMSTSQLLAVPYALHAKTVEKKYLIDYEFPYGMEGEYILLDSTTASYTVPSGKVLQTLDFQNISLVSSDLNVRLDVSLVPFLWLPELTTIRLNSSCCSVLVGILFNERPEITPFFYTANQGSQYTVPEGQILILMKSPDLIRLNGFDFTSSSSFTSSLLTSINTFTPILEGNTLGRHSFYENLEVVPFFWGYLINKN